MRSSQRVYLWTTAACLLSLCLFVGTMVGLWVRALAGHTSRILASELASQLNRPTHIGALTTTWSGAVAVRDIRVADRTDPSRALFRARSVTVRVAPWRALWTSDGLVSTISGMKLDRPELFLSRDKSGRWNVEDLLRAQAKAPPSRFRGVLTASNALLVVRDATGRLTDGRRALVLRGVTASADLRRPERRRYRIAGTALQPQRAPFALAADLDAKHGRADLSVRAQGVQAALVSRALRHPQISVPAGTVDVDAAFSVMRRRVLLNSLQGRIAVTGARVRVKGPPVDIGPLEAAIRASGGEARLDAEALVGGAPVHLSGRAVLTEAPAVDLSIAAPRISQDALREVGAVLQRGLDVELPAAASANARITGTLSRPSVDLRLQAPEAAGFGVRVRNIDVHARLEEGRLYLDELAADLAGGALRASGWLAVPPLSLPRQSSPAGRFPRFALAGSFGGVDLSAVYPKLSKRIAGRASGRFTAQSDGRRQSFRANAYVPTGRISWASFTDGRADIQSTDGRVWEAYASADEVRALRSTFTGASGQLQLSQSGIRIQGASAEGWAGRIFASGSVHSDGRLALRLTAQGVSAPSFLRGVGLQERCSGTVDFWGRLSGTVAKPLLDGQMHALGGMWRNALFDRVVGRVSVSGGRLSFRSVELARDGSTAGLNADVRFPPNAPARVSASAETKDMPLSLAARLLGSEAEPAGVLAGSLHAEGPADSIVIRGEVTASDIPLPTGTASVSARFEHTPAGTRIENARLTSEGVSFSGDGTVSPDRTLNIRLQSDAVELASLNKALPPQVHLSGTAQAEVSLAGPLESPDIVAHASSSAVSINGAEPASARASIYWSNRRVAVENAWLRLSDGGAVAVQGRYAPERKWLSAVLWARDVDLQHVIRAAEYAAGGEPPPWLEALLQPATPAVSGRVDADIAAVGPASRLAGTGAVAIANPTLGPQPFHELSCTVSWNPNEVLVSNCVLSGPGLLVVGDADFPRGDQPTVVLSAPSASVQKLIRTAESVSSILPPNAASALTRSLQSLPQPASGTVSAGVSLARLGGQVSGTAGFTAQPLILRGERLDHVEGGFAVRDNRVLVRSLTAEGEQLRAAVTGSAGFGGEMDLDIEASNVNLAALAPLFGIGGPVSGLADISAKAGGTIERPTLRASASASSLAVGDFRTRLVSAPGIVVEGDTLNLGNVAVAGDTFQATLSGTLPFSWSPLEVPNDKPIDLSISLGRQDLSVLADISPEITEAQGYVTGALRIGGTLKHPAVRGSAEAVADTLTLARARNGLRNVRAVVQFDERTAQLQSLQAESDLGGRLTGRGWAALTGMPRPDFRLELTASDLECWLANASGIYGEVFRGAVNGSVVLSRQQDQPPHLEGELTASHGFLTLPTQPPKTALRPAAALPNIALGGAGGEQPLLFRIGKGFQLVRGGLRASLTDDIRLSGFLSEPEVAGTLTFENGTVRFATQRFRIVPGGTMTIAYSPARGARATLDVSAQTTAYARVGPNGQRERYTIIVDLSGPIENPRAAFSSDPPGLSRRQILAVVGRQAELEAILRGQDADRILREQLGQAFAGALVPEITSPIERAVAEALGLEEFAILYDLGAETQVQVTKQLAGRLFLTYRRNVAGARQDFLWKLAYRIQRRLQLSFSVDERHVRTFAVEGRIHF